MNKVNNSEPSFVTLAEMPCKDLHAGSGIYEEDGSAITNYAAIQMIG